MRQFTSLITLTLLTTATGLHLLLKSQIQNAKALPHSKLYAFRSAQVATIAEQISVRIDGQAPGSGILFAKQGQTYYVLTAAHVVATPDEYDVVTPDGQKYRVNYAQVKKLPGIDLAVVYFTSTRNYQVAKLGNSSKVQRGAPVFVAGWPAGGNAITNPTLLFQQGIVSANSQVTQADGYGLIYTNNTLPGMSGGPVLNSAGELIGVHGKGETDGQQGTQNSGVMVKVGYNLGVPINTFLRLAPKAGINLPAITTAIAVAGPAPATPNPTRRVDDFIAEAANKTRQEDYPGAIAALDRAIAADPKAADAYRLRAEARLGTIVWSERAMKSARNKEVMAAALADIDQAIQLDPKSSDAWSTRAVIKGVVDPKAAFVDIEEAIRLAPNSSSPYKARAYINAEEKNWQATIADATQAITMEPNSPFIYEVYNLRGFALFSLKDYAGAIKDYTQAIRLRSKSAHLHINRGYARAYLKDFQGGLTDMQRGADLAIEQNDMDMHAVALRGLNNIRLLMR